MKLHQATSGRLPRPAAGTTALAVIALLLVSGCTIFVPEDYASDIRWDGGFARSSLGVVPAAKFFGELKGIGPGVGGSLEIPPLYPAVCVGSAAAAVAVTAPFWLIDAALKADGDLAGDVTGEIFEDMMQGAADAGVLDSGISDPRRLLLSDVSVDLSFVSTRHVDETFGGHLTYTAGMLGIRAGGNRGLRPRPFICGGWGVYRLDFDAPERNSTQVTGPWCGAGAEFFVTRGFAVSIDARAHFFINATDGDGLIDSGLGHGNVALSWYW